MKVFLIFGIVDFQDMMTSIITFSKYEKVWVIICDCLSKKRQLYYYNKEEIIKYVRDSVSKNGNEKNLEVSYYHQNEKNKCDKKIKDRKNDIDLIFLQGIYHKHPRWLPNICNLPVVYFAWGKEGTKNIALSPIKKNLIFTVLRHPEDVEFYIKNNINSSYFGNFWKESLSMHNIERNKEFLNLDDKKVIFIPESWWASHGKTWSSESVRKIIDPVLDLAIKENYFTLVKKREKGYPDDMSKGFLNFLSKEKISNVIAKDLYFPSLLYFAPIFSKKIIFFGTKTQGMNSIINLYKSINYNHTLIVNHDNFNMTNICDFLRTENCKNEKNKLLLEIKNNSPSEKLREYCNEYLR